MIRQALAEDRPQIIGLWQEAFGDSEEEALFYFQHRHKDQNMLVFVEDGQVQGMLSLLPVLLKGEGQALKARYIFAVATRLAQRGRGISTHLMEAAHRLIAQEGGHASVLVPASEALFQFYGKRGYTTGFYTHQADFHAEALDKVVPLGTARRCAAKEYRQGREAFFRQSRLYMSWDLEGLRFYEKSLHLAGGELLHLTGPQGQAYCCCEPRGDFIRVSEYLNFGMDREQAMALVHRHYDVEHYQLRTWPKEEDGKEALPFGMIRWVQQPPPWKGRPPHLAFAKD